MATGAMGTVLKYNNAVVGKLTGVGEIAPESEELDVTTLDSAGGYREFIQGYRDSGTVELTGFHEKGNAGQAALRAAYDSGAAGSVEVSFPDGTVVSFRAFVKGYTLGAAEVDGAVGFGAVLRVTGAVTVKEA